MKIQIKILNEEFYTVHNFPMYATVGSAGLDLCCTHNAMLLPDDCFTLNTGLAISIENESLMGLIVPRSSLGSKGLVLANTVGIIDSDYQGELLIKLLNRSKRHVYIAKGDRVAQLIFVPVQQVIWDIVKEFSYTSQRGEGGFGSTGA